MMIDAVRAQPAPLALSLTTLAILSLALGACGGGGDDDRVGPGATIRVPADAETISEAVERAEEGDLVLISPGTYEESVEVRTPDIVIRGVSRNRVVLDGEGMRANGMSVVADGVSVENLTVRNHTVNGVLFTAGADDDGGYGEGDPANQEPLERFAARYVTAYNNGLYGIYAFTAQHGVIEHSYASGHPDSGLYVGQCKPCDVVVRSNTAELNAVGYEGTNASDDLFVVENRLTRNRVGLTTNSEEIERLAPQENATIAGNLVGSNDERGAPQTADGGFGAGIAINGGSENVISDNRVADHPVAGIVLVANEGFAPIGNRVEDNVLTGNWLDLAYAPSADAPGRGNCFTGNDFQTTVPPRAEERHPCPPGDESVAGGELPRVPDPPGPDFLDVKPPPRQPEMPGKPTATPTPLPDTPQHPRLGAIETPPDDLVPDGTTPHEGGAASR